MTVLVDFQPVGRRGECATGRSLLDCARDLGVDLTSVCGGVGTCRRCRIQLISGSLSEPTASERRAISSGSLEQEYRLACQAHPQTDCRVRVPAESLTAVQRTQVEGQEITVAPAPVVFSRRLVLTEPTMDDLAADDVRVLSALREQHSGGASRIDVDVLRVLSTSLRNAGWDVQASIRGHEVIAVNPWPSGQLGLAVDLGTTKLAGYLVDLGTGQTLAARGAMNPQISYGENVIARIGRAGTAEGAATMRELIVSSLNALAGELCVEVGAEPGALLDAVIVGNTAMHHLLLGLPVAQLGVAPYVPAVRHALDLKARDAGLRMAPGAYVHLLPNVAGFVGADHVAMLAATGVTKAAGNVIALDIGTNTEVCLISHGRMTSVSCASGPAFEGAHIRDGMRAADGAIERVLFEGGRVEYQTISGAPPIGVCGSGIIDAIAQLHLAGVVNRMGRLGDHARVRNVEGRREFVLVSEEERDGRSAIVVSQEDIREIQLAKGAIRAGIETLLREGALLADEIDEIVIAGAFGTYIDVSSAIDIGMLPRVPVDRVRQVGNAAGMGAKLALISEAGREEARTIGMQVGYLELAATPAFSSVFVEATLLS